MRDEEAALQDHLALKQSHKTRDQQGEEQVVCQNHCAVHRHGHSTAQLQCSTAWTAGLGADTCLKHNVDNLVEPLHLPEQLQRPEDP